MVLRNRFRWLKRQLPSIRYQICTKQTFKRKSFYVQSYLTESKKYYHNSPGRLESKHITYSNERWKEKQKQLWEIPIIRQLYDYCELEDCRRRLK